MDRRVEPGRDRLSLWLATDGWLCNCMVVRDGRLLMLQRKPDGYLGGLWDLPGGKTDPGEEPAATALRELAEEAGLSAHNPVELAHFTNPDKRDESKLFHVITYRVEELQPDLQVRLSKEHPAFQWVTVDEFATLPVVSYVRRVLGDGAW